MKMKSTKVILTTIVVILLTGIYQFLINKFFPNLDPLMAKFIRKFLQALTIVIYIFIIGWWKNIASLKNVSFKSLYLILPVIIISFIPILNGFKENSAYGIFMTLLIALLIGFIEEIECRGIIFSALEHMGAKSSILISSVIFALLHLLNLCYGADILDTLVQVVFAFGFGLVMAAATYKTHSLLPQMLVHALWDFNSDITNTFEF
jgi:membrane protease YdiL (CAAX protease family)